MRSTRPTRPAAGPCSTSSTPSATTGTPTGSTSPAGPTTGAPSTSLTPRSGSRSYDDAQLGQRPARNTESDPRLSPAGRQRLVSFAIVRSVPGLTARRLGRAGVPSLVALQTLDAVHVDDGLEGRRGA